MIEDRILADLGEALSIPVSVEKPKGEKTFILVDKTGSEEKDKIKSATFAVQSYAQTLREAALLNEKTKIAMEGMKALANISSVKLNTDYDFTDEETKEYRYQAVYDLVYME